MSRLPRWRLTMCFTIARPRPVPPSSRERAASTRPNRSVKRGICSWRSPRPDRRRRGDRWPWANGCPAAFPGRRPGPRSARSSRISPGSGLYLMALSTRFWIAWVSSSGSRNGRQLGRAGNRILICRCSTLKTSYPPTSGYCRDQRVEGGVLVHLDP